MNSTISDVKAFYDSLGDAISDYTPHSAGICQFKYLECIACPASSGHLNCKFAEFQFKHHLTNLMREKHPELFL